MLTKLDCSSLSLDLWLDSQNTYLSLFTALRTGCMFETQAFVITRVGEEKTLYLWVNPYDQWEVKGSWDKEYFSRKTLLEVVSVARDVKVTAKGEYFPWLEG
ncbi:MAG: hypothetical protein AAB443_02640 [Patescibacteria group bacterium]